MKRLYDFTVGNAIMACVAYALLLGLFGFGFFDGKHPALFGTIFVLLSLSFLLIVWFFVLMSPKITPTELRHGSKSIAKQNVRFKVIYYARFKETQIRLRDVNKEYRYLDSKALKKAEIRIQATPANLKKLGDWLDCEIVIPEEATAKYYRKSLRKTKNDRTK